MIRCRRWLDLLSLLVLVLAWSGPAAAAPEGRADAPAGQLTWAVHTTLVPAWFDPIEMPSVITPFMVLYGLHDAVVKPMPGQAMAPSLAESLDRAKQAALLHRMQQIVHERAMFAPIDELAFLNGVGPRVEESGLGLIAGYAYSAPYEDLKLKAK